MENRACPSLRGERTSPLIVQVRIVNGNCVKFFCSGPNYDANLPLLPLPTPGYVPACFDIRQYSFQLWSSSSSFICSNKKTHTWSTREQEQDEKGTENWRLHFAHKKRKKKHTRYKNNYYYHYYNYDYAYRKNAEKSTRLSDRLNLDNDENGAFSVAGSVMDCTLSVCPCPRPCLNLTRP